MLLYKPKPQDAGGLGRVGHLTSVWWDGLTYWNPDGTAAAPRVLPRCAGGSCTECDTCARTSFVPRMTNGCG